MEKTTRSWDEAYPPIPLVKHRFVLSWYTQAGNGRLFSHPINPQSQRTVSLYATALRYLQSNVISIKKI